MSSVLRPVRQRKKGRTLGPVNIIQREDYTDLELDKGTRAPHGRLRVAVGTFT